MTRALWLSDLHLNFVSDERLDKFLEAIVDSQADALLLGGDIAESSDVASFLLMLSERMQLPIYFVLGNHDYYFSSIAAVRRQVGELCQVNPGLVYLTQSEPIELAPGVGLVGHDGWGDGRFGDYERSLVSMNDYRLIRDLAGRNKLERLAVLHALGDQAGDHIRRQLPAALTRWNHVVLLTHVPPLRAACWYNGQTSDDAWAPHFTCKAVGNALIEVMQEHRDRRLTVLCGHTHSPGITRPLENVTIYTAAAEYGQPAIQQAWQLDA